ncbi:Hypp8349 [Branchiostoma lanceolatum]|uniref:Hypp8349 protein n=1 Tax=Branchiostoma lanceolatum TaxID=7740 RepID=A0A8K0EHK3_BRALA|nr:Hypp8349 [Branchiostoma lanceolatum]
MAERAVYYQRREVSRKEPDKYLSLIVDGMDQAKTFLPHFVGDKSKDLTTVDQMKVHVSGIMSHGHGLRSTYIDFFEYPHDSNLTLNLLLKLLRRLSKVGTEWVLPKLPQYEEEHLAEEPTIPEDLRMLLEKEQENPEQLAGQLPWATGRATALSYRPGNCPELPAGQLP